MIRQPTGGGEQLLKWRIRRRCEQLVPNVLHDQTVTMRLFSHFRPFRVVSERIPRSCSLVGILERHHVSQLVIALANIGGPVANVFDPVLFKKLGRVIGESSIDCR